MLITFNWYISNFNCWQCAINFWRSNCWSLQGCNKVAAGPFPWGCLVKRDEESIKNEISVVEEKKTVWRTRWLTCRIVSNVTLQCETKHIVSLIRTGSTQLVATFCWIFWGRLKTAVRKSINRVSPLCVIATIRRFKLVRDYSNNLFAR